MEPLSLFTPAFLAITPQTVSAEVKKNGYYVFENALNQSFIDALVMDFNSSEVLENSTEILPHYRFQCKNFMYGLAVSRHYFNLLTHSKVFEICQEILGDRFSLYSHRYYESFLGNELPWHIDSKDDKTQRRNETQGLQFLFYCVDVLDGETEAIHGSNSENVDGLVTFSKDLIASKFSDRVKGFRLPAGSIVVMDTKTIHRAAPVLTPDYVRKLVQFRINEGCVDGQGQIVNASFFDPERDTRLKWYFKFGVEPTSGHGETGDIHIPTNILIRRITQIIVNKVKAQLQSRLQKISKSLA